jgi:arylsulfatase A-like enzyme
VYRTGLSKVGMPGVDVGLQAEDPTIAELLKPLGYATGQFGKNLCTDSYCKRYRPAARRPQMIDTGMSHIGFRCIRDARAAGSDNT